MLAAHDIAIAIGSAQLAILIAAHTLVTTGEETHGQRQFQHFICNSGGGFSTQQKAPWSNTVDQLGAAVYLGEGDVGKQVFFRATELAKQTPAPARVNGVVGTSASPVDAGNSRIGLCFDLFFIGDAS